MNASVNSWYLNQLGITSWVKRSKPQKTTYYLISKSSIKKEIQSFFESLFQYCKPDENLIFLDEMSFKKHSIDIEQAVIFLESDIHGFEHVKNLIKLPSFHQNHGLKKQCFMRFLMALDAS